jgi:hypothetical protein
MWKVYDAVDTSSSTTTSSFIRLHPKLSVLPPDVRFPAFSQPRSSSDARNSISAYA